MIPGGALAEREAVDEVPGFRACVVQRYFSHVLPFPQSAFLFTTLRRMKYASILQPGVKVLHNLPLSCLL